MHKGGHISPPLQKSVRVEGIEPSTTCLKGRCSTTELHPLAEAIFNNRHNSLTVKRKFIHYYNSFYHLTATKG